jgi:hypothetical protein
MARFLKTRARKPLAEESISTGVTNYRDDGGLRFTISCGDYKISLTHMEKDHVIEQWNKMQQEHEK